MGFSMGFGGGQPISISFGDYNENEEFYRPYEEPIPQNTSYHNPNDGIATPQEPQIRQEETRIENANKDKKEAFVTGGVAAFTAGVGAASKEPITTTLACAQVVYSYRNLKETYATEQEAKERFNRNYKKKKSFWKKAKGIMDDF